MSARATSDIELIRRSPLFDEGWYREQAGLPASADAAAHYLAEGATMGLDPSRHFSNEEYLALNPDVAQAQVNPLLHYERFGRAEGRPCGRAIAMDGDYREHARARAIMRGLGRALNRGRLARNAGARVLVILHVFYASSIPEIRQYLENLAPYRPKLIVSYVTGCCDEEDLAPLRELGDVELRPCENRGYDLAPFFEVLGDIDLACYDIVFKLHSKSTTRERFSYGARFAPREWFMRLFDGIIGPFSVHRAIDLLMGDPACGLVAEESLLALEDPPHIRRMVRDRLEARGLPAPDGAYRFVSGTCFAARADALEALRDARIVPQDFASVRYGVFSLAHALERFACTEVSRQGKRLQGIATHRLWGAWSQRIADRRYSKNGLRMSEALRLRLSDDDLISLYSIFAESWEVAEVPLGEMLSLDREGRLFRLDDADGRLCSKDGEPWEGSAELTAWIDSHFMRAGDAELARMDAVPFSQAIVVNSDNYIVCGRDLAYALLEQHGPSAKAEVVRYAPAR